MGPELILLDRKPSSWHHAVSVNCLAQSVDEGRLIAALHECGGPVANLLIHQVSDASGAAKRRWAWLRAANTLRAETGFIGGALKHRQLRAVRCSRSRVDVPRLCA